MLRQMSQKAPCALQHTGQRFFSVYKNDISLFSLYVDTTLFSLPHFARLGCQLSRNPTEMPRVGCQAEVWRASGSQWEELGGKKKTIPRSSEIFLLSALGVVFRSVTPILLTNPGTQNFPAHFPPELL